MSTVDPNAFLTGGGTASAFGKDDPVGTTWSGRICEPLEVKQQTDIKDGSPMFWDNGDPKMQLIVTIQASNVPITDDDDGKRRFYVKGSKTSGSKSMHDAVATAVRNAGAKGLEVGGTLTVRLIGSEPSKTRGYNDRKLYDALYVAPDRTAEAAGFLGLAPLAPTQGTLAEAAPLAPLTPPAAVATSPETPPASAPATGPSPEQLAAFENWQKQQAAAQSA